MLGLQTHQHRNTGMVIRAGSLLTGLLIYLLDALLPGDGLKMSSARYSDGTSTPLAALRWSEGCQREVGILACDDK